MKEHGRHLLLDGDAERRLLEGAKACRWRRLTCELFRDIVTLMRDTGMRNQRELYRARIENLDWESRVIFVPDSKTPEGRRLIPMSRRVFELLRTRCATRTDSWVFPSKRAAFGSRVLNRSPVSRGETASRPSQGTGPLLCPP
jgi:integrase